MRRPNFRLSVFLTAVGIFCSATLLAAEDANLAAVRAKIGEMFAAIEPENVYPSAIDGWYTVQKGSIVAYVSSDGRYLLQGDMIDLDSNINLSEQSRNSARRKLMSSIGDDQMIVFSPADVKHSVTIFTDIDCTYCRKLHSEIDEYLAHGIEVRYLLYPRNGPRSPSWSTSEDVWCAKDRNRALTEAKLERNFSSDKCDASIITKHYMLGQEVGLTGTPAILMADGTLLSGYLPPAALASRLQQEQQSAQQTAATAN